MPKSAKPESWGPYYSTKLHYYVNFGVKHGSKLFIHPFYYDNATGQVRSREDWTYYLTYPNLGLAFAYYGFLIGQLVRINLEKGTPLVVNLVTQDIIVYLTCAWLLPLMVLTGGRDVCALANGCAEFHSRVSCNLTYYTGKDKLWELKLIERIMDALLLSCYNLMFLFTALAIKFPQLPFFLSSLLADPNGTDIFSLCIRALSAILVIYESILFFTGGFVILPGIASICFSLVPIMKHMRSKTAERSITPEDFKILTELRLLVETLNRCYTRFGLPISVTVLIAFSVYGIYALIKLSGILGMLVIAIGVNGYTILVYQFRGLAGLHKHSVLLLESWKSRPTNDKILQKMLVAQQPLKVKLGNSFIDVGIILTATDIIVNNAITLLLL